MNFYYLFKLSLRSLLRNKVFALINIIGLAIGLSTCLLLFLYINNELSYDSSVPDADRIFRINTTLNESETWARGFLCLHEAGKNDIPEVESSTCFNFIDKILINVNDVSQYEDNIMFADTNFLSFFGIEQKSGESDALTKPNSVLLSENTAQKHFGHENPIGRNFQIDGIDYNVAGVIENPEPNIHFTYNVVGSIQGEREKRTYQTLKARKAMGFYIYYKLFDKEKYKDVEKKFPTLMKKYLGDSHGPPIEAFVASLQTLKSIHLDSHHQFELKANSNRKYIRIFSFIGLLILLIACVNFINMYTASSSSRNKEIGIKKIIGANRSQLIKQFLLESFLLNLGAFFAAIILVEIIRPFFNSLIHDEIVIHYSNFKVIFFSIFLLLGSTVLSGGYIAVYLAGISPISRLVINLDRKRKRLKLRDILVILQFSCAISLIASTLLINKQISYLQNKNVGFDKENILVIHMRNSIDKRDLIKSKFLELNDVNKAGYSQHHFARALQPNAFGFKDESFSISSVFADYDCVELLGLEFIHKNFEDKSELDGNIIINKTLLNEIKSKFPDYSYEDILESSEQLKGVVNDFNFYSLHEKIGAFAFLISPEISSRYLHIKYKTNNFSAFIKDMENVWEEIHPDYPFEYFFLDQAMDDKYKSDKTFGIIVKSFSYIAILISCLGLFGLSLFHTQQRVKEIGIRKTLGATTASILMLLNKSYSKWVLSSVIIASPFVYYYMNKWLSGFAYKIAFDWLSILLAGILSLIIAFITISLQSLKSSRTKPVDSLRYE